MLSNRSQDLIPLCFELSQFCIQQIPSFLGCLQVLVQNREVGSIAIRILLQLDFNLLSQFCFLLLLTGCQIDLAIKELFEVRLVETWVLQQSLLSRTLFRLLLLLQLSDEVGVHT